MNTTAGSGPDHRAPVSRPTRPAVAQHTGQPIGQRPAAQQYPAHQQHPAQAAPATAVWVDDPHAVVRRGICATLAAEEFTIVGESERLQPLPQINRIGTLVFDADGPATGTVLGLTAGRPVRLVATVRRPEDTRLHELVSAGVSAILFHDDLTPQLLLDTVRAVARDRSSLPTDLLPRLLERASRVSTSSPGALTDRERRVLQMLSEGEDTRAIALGLSYSERTVKNVVHDVLTKLNCRTRAQAVGLATRAGVI